MSENTGKSDLPDSNRKWYEGITRYQWLVLTIASLGWMFDVFEGQIFVLMIIAVAAAEVAVGLGILLALIRNRNSLNVDDVSMLRW